MVNQLTLPMDADIENDRIVGRDELGMPVRMTRRGERYLVSYPSEQPAPRLPGLLETTLDDQGRAIHTRRDLEPTMTGTALGGLLGAFTEGMTAPGRALGGESVSLGDVWNTAIDNGMLAAPMPAPRGAIRSGAMRAADSPADNIAAMLREGRASDITDDMMAALSPEDNAQLFRLYEQGATGVPMPMDEASRMGRARDIYEQAARNARADGFVPGLRTVEGPEYMTTQSRSWSDGVRGDRTLAGTSATSMRDMDRAARLHRLGSEPLYSEGYYPGDTTGVIAGERVRSGRDGGEVILRNPDEYLVRSRAARFDPRLSHLAHLSAAGVGAVPALGLLSGGPSEQQRADEVRQYLGLLGGL